MTPDFLVAETTATPARRVAPPEAAAQAPFHLDGLPLSSAAVQRLQASAGNAAVAPLLVQRCGGERHEGCADCS